MGERVSEELIERLRRSCTGTNEGDAATMAEAADRLEALEEALRDCIRRLRTCALSGGTSPEMVDILCAQFEAVLTKDRP